MAGKVLRGVSIVVGVVAGLVVALAAFIYVASNARLHRVYAVEIPALPLPTDAASFARGEHVARAIAGCVDCHGGLLEGHVVMALLEGQGISGAEAARVRAMIKCAEEARKPKGGTQ